MKCYNETCEVYVQEHKSLSISVVSTIFNCGREFYELRPLSVYVYFVRFKKLWLTLFPILMTLCTSLSEVSVLDRLCV